MFLGLKGEVLNLIITGISSILLIPLPTSPFLIGFKPYYNWNIFNTMSTTIVSDRSIYVLNLIITGISSIPLVIEKK